MGIDQAPDLFPDFKWTDEAIASLRALWAGGCTANEIANELGTSRNAVCGKVHRLGLEGRRDVRNRAGRKVGAKDKKPRKRRFVLDTARFLRDIGVAVDLPPALPPVTAVFLLELKDHHCRWPYGQVSGNMLFCGAIKFQGHAYCAGHCRIAYRLPTRRDAPPRTDHPWKDKGIAA